MRRLNSLRSIALAALLKETFSHFAQHVRQKHIDLVHKNNLIRGTSASYFMHNGFLYPTETPEGLSTIGMQMRAPPLHWSLTGELEQVAKIGREFQYNYIKNFFSDVLSISANGMVLDALLPPVLVDAIRKEFTQREDFETLNHGVEWQFGVAPAKAKPDDAVQADIEHLQYHYEDAIMKVRELLMEKLLLE